MIKVIGVLACAAVVGGRIYFHGPIGEPNVYSVPIDVAYAKLSADVPANGSTYVSGEKGKFVKWTSNGTFASSSCTANLSADDAKTTRITPVCEGGSASDGVAGGMAMNLRINAFIERIDALMTDRPYDKSRAVGATAAGWPKQEIEAVGLDGVKASLDKHIERMDKMADEAKERKKEMRLDAEMRNRSEYTE